MKLTTPLKIIGSVILIFALSFFFSCQKDEIEENLISATSGLDTNYTIPTNAEGFVSIGDVDTNTLEEGTLQYYRNIAAVIDWYAEHPEKRNRPSLSFKNKKMPKIIIHF